MTEDYRHLIEPEAADRRDRQEATGAKLGPAHEHDETAPDHPYQMMGNDCRAIDGEQISQRTKHGLRRAAEQGYFVGTRAPYPYRRVRLENRRFVLQPDPTAADTVRGISAMCLRKWSDEEMAEELNDFCVPSPSGGRWTPRMVGRVLSDPILTGTYAFRKSSDSPVLFPNAFPAVISQREFNQVQEVRRHMYSTPKYPGRWN